MEINVKGTTAEIIVLLNMLEQRSAILDTNKITEEAINEMKDKIPPDDNLLLNIFNNGHWNKEEWIDEHSQHDEEGLRCGSPP